jgi:ABC-type bacteriocin/lantibiotic exporter with double-glycine peptidase domain
MFKKVISVFLFCCLIISSGCIKRQSQQEIDDRAEANYLKEETIKNFHEIKDIQSSAEIISAPKKLEGSEMMFVKVKYNIHGSMCLITSLTNVKNLKVGEKVLVKILLSNNGAVFSIVDRLPVE